MDTDKNIAKHNSLINAPFDVTQNEYRLINGLISSVNGKTTGDASQVFTMSAADYYRLYPESASRQSVYQLMMEAAKSLQKKPAFSLQFEENGKMVTRTASWFDYIDYIPTDSVVRCRFTSMVYEGIHNLHIRKNFTKYKVKYHFDFKSIYSSRIYELLKENLGKSKVNTANRKILVDEIRELFELHDKYLQVGALKSWVIDIAVKEITEKSDISVEVSTVKEGRKVTSFMFIATLKGSKNVVTQSKNIIKKSSPKSAASFLSNIQASLNAGASLSDALPGESADQYKLRKTAEFNKNNG